MYQQICVFIVTVCGLLTLAFLGTMFGSYLFNRFNISNLSNNAKRDSLKLELFESLNCTICGHEGGVYKRIDENRELLSLLKNETPEFFVKYPWVEGWLKSNDNYLVALSQFVDVDDCHFKPVHDNTRDFPRLWPSCKLDGE